MSVQPTPPLDEDVLRGWIGRQTRSLDTAGAGPLRLLAATLGREFEGGEAAAVPPLWHWLYFLSAQPPGDLGPDGHPRRGGFLPPVPLPRRMWAGSRLVWRRRLRVGETLERLSTIEDVALKQGRSGPLAFVTVRHEVRAPGDGEPALVEHHDIVYRAASPAGAAPLAAEPSAATAAPWMRDLVPDAVLLFRYSALTFNGHRIHYDQPYATQDEGYPSLVVHGPLIATLLLDLMHRHTVDIDLRRFEFRALAPAFAGQQLMLRGAPAADGGCAQLWACNDHGHVLMRAQADFG
jgi:3-methylfumaryl-CoA hydratase